MHNGSQGPLLTEASNRFFWMSNEYGESLFVAVGGWSYLLQVREWCCELPRSQRDVEPITETADRRGAAAGQRDI